MEVFDILHKDCVAVDVAAKRKEDVVLELARLAHRSPTLSGKSVDDIYKALWEREKRGSTGVGNGVAIPHAPLTGLDEFVLALAISKKGVDFDALDKKKVHIFAVILGPPDQPKAHIKLLAQISHVFRSEDATHRILRADTSLGLYEAFAGCCRPKSIAGGDKSKRQKVFVVVIQGEEVFHEVVETLAELGVGGASVLDSTGLRSPLSGMPLFADFIHFFGEHSDNSHTMIFTVYEKAVDDTVRAIEEVTGDLETHGGAMIMVFEPWFIKGSLELL
jgi:mannitol/fructose-specific phosphotransferase system IIA component (Ntr-type)